MPQKAGVVNPPLPRTFLTHLCNPGIYVVTLQSECSFTMWLLHEFPWTASLSGKHRRREGDPEFHAEVNGDDSTRR